MCAYCVLIDSRLVYAATHARSVLESGGALPLPGPRFDLDTDHSLPRSSKIFQDLPRSWKPIQRRPTYIAAAVATIVLLLLVTQAPSIKTSVRDKFAGLNWVLLVLNGFGTEFFCRSCSPVVSLLSLAQVAKRALDTASDKEPSWAEKCWAVKQQIGNFRHMFFRNLSESFMLLASMIFRVMTRHEEFHCSFCSRTSCPGIEVLSLEWAPEENAPNTAYQKQTNVQLSSAFYFLVPECVARVPVSLWGSGGWGCVRSTLRSRAQPSATVRNRSREDRMAVPMGSFTEVVLFGGFRRLVASFRVAGVALRDIQTCSATCRKSFCVAGAILLRRFSEDVLQFSWQAQHFGRVHRHFSWQAQHSRRVLWRVFYKSHWQGCVKWWQGANSVAGVAFSDMCWKLTEASHETSILRLQIFRF